MKTKRVKTAELPFSLECEYCDGCASGDGVGSEANARRLGWTCIRRIPDEDRCPTSNFYGRCPVHTIAARLSDSMRRAVRNLKRGEDIAAHVRGDSQHGGFGSTVFALTKLKLITNNASALTDLGDEVVDALDDL